MSLGLFFYNEAQHALGNFVEATFVVQATVSLYCTVDLSIQYNIVSVLSVLLLCLMLYSQYCNKDNREGGTEGEGGVRVRTAGGARATTFLEEEHVNGSSKKALQ